MHAKTDQPDRRTFLKLSSGIAVGSWAAAAAGRVRASGSAADTVTVAIIGCGIRGGHLLRAFQRVPGCAVAAVCDVHRERLARARDVAGSNVLATTDYRRILDRKDIDAVVVATPDQWHVLITVHACQAGKDVYVEKPLGVTIGEGRAAVQAARKYNRVVQIGTQQRSWTHYAEAVEILRSGELGTISEVKVWDYENQYPGFGNPPDEPPPPELDWDFWLGPSPLVPYNRNRYFHHYWFFDYGGAWQVDWAVHHYDIVHWAMGINWPRTATASGGKLCFDDNRDWPDTFEGILEYGPCELAPKGFLLQYTFRGGCRRERHNHAKLFCGTNGSMLLDRSGYYIIAETRKGKTVIKSREVRAKEPPRHQEVFVNNVRERKRPFADIEDGHYATNPGHLLNIAWRLGRKITWDGEKEQVVGDDEANALLNRPFRAPWQLTI